MKSWIAVTLKRTRIRKTIVMVYKGRSLLLHRYFYRCDITNHDSVQNTAKIVQQEVGDVTILINVANEFGLKQSAAQFWDIDVERTLRVNTLSQFWVNKYVLKSYVYLLQKRTHFSDYRSVFGTYEGKQPRPHCRCFKFFRYVRRGQL